MAKLIKTWEELSQVPANDKYRIIVNDGCGWIVPVTDKPGDDELEDFICNGDTKNMSFGDFHTHHVYLSTHTFYGSRYEYSTRFLQDHGFDIEIDNWDKENI